MKKQALIMGMPIVIDVVDSGVKETDIDQVFYYFRYIDRTFSTYKYDSEIERINRGEIMEDRYSDNMKRVMALCEETRRETDGYFDIRLHGKLDPSGLVKGWAIYHGAEMLHDKGFRNFYVDVGGDVEARGSNANGEPWSIGIRNPFNQDEIVKIVRVRGKGVATSGTYARGQHIYDPIHKKAATDMVSLTVIGPNIYEADRLSTPVFAMGLPVGLEWLERRPGLEGYAIMPDKRAHFTSGFKQYVDVEERLIL